MKKLVMATAALVALSAGAAQAEINLDIGIGQPAYYQPAPVIVEQHPYLPGHFNGRDRHHEGRDWRYDHDEHHDNGRHLGEYKHDERR